LRQANPRHQQWEYSEQSQHRQSLDRNRRPLVEEAIREVCRHRDWLLHALNVRTEHVHVVVSCEAAPEFAMNSFKSWATRRIRARGHGGPAERIWSRHGSTLYLWTDGDLASAISYVIEQQGADI
jgi:REP element-mobilizing transposase RayT